MKRSAPRQGYLASADVLRVACIGLVGWYHIWQQSWLNPSFSIGSVYVNLQQVVRNGYMMVDVLMVLSGFLLAMPHAKAAQGQGLVPRPQEFYRKRFWRIFPCYAAVILLTLIFWAIPQELYATPGAMVKDLLAHFTFTHNLFYNTYYNTPLPGVLWTMGVEVQFYLFFPLIARFFRKKPAVTCLILSAISWGFRIWTWQLPSEAMWLNQLPCMLDLFACGMAAAWLYIRWKDREIRLRHRVLLALGALLAFLLMLQVLFLQTLDGTQAINRGQLFWRLPLGLLGGAFLLCGSLAPAGLQRALGNPITCFLSSLTFNFYIWHQFLAVRLKALHIPAYTAENPAMAGEQPWQRRYTLLCFLGASAIAAVFTYLVEKPLVRWAARREMHDSSIFGQKRKT